MNAMNMKKAAYLGLLGFLFLAFVSFVPSASAKSDNDNNDHGRRNRTKLYSITDVTANSVVLPIRNRKFKNETVHAVVSVKNDSTGAIVERPFKVSLNNKGIGSIKVSNLARTTAYKFKVRLFRNTDANKEEDRGGKNSSSRKASTQ